MNDKDLYKIKINSIKANEPLACSVYIYLALNNKYIKLRDASQFFETASLENYINKGHTTLFIEDPNNNPTILEEIKVIQNPYLEEFIQIDKSAESNVITEDSSNVINFSKPPESEESTPPLSISSDEPDNLLNFPTASTDELLSRFSTTSEDDFEQTIKASPSIEDDSVFHFKADKIDDLMDQELTRIISQKSDEPEYKVIIKNTPIENESKKIFILTDLSKSMLEKKEKLLELQKSNKDKAKEEEIFIIKKSINEEEEEFIRIKASKDLTEEDAKKHEQSILMLDKLLADKKGSDAITALSKKIEEAKNSMISTVAKITEAEKSVEELTGETKPSSFVVSNFADDFTIQALFLANSQGYKGEKFLTDLALAAYHWKATKKASENTLPAYTMHIIDLLENKTQASRTIDEDTLQIIKITNCYYTRPEKTSGKIKFDPAIFDHAYRQLSQDESINSIILEKSKQYIEKHNTQIVIDDCTFIANQAKKTYGTLLRT